MSLAEALDALVAAKHLTLLQPSPPPAVLPANYDPSRYCKYHQSHGHYTNNCVRLRHSIQDLIDTKKIAPPNPKPNRAFLPPDINFIDDLAPFDPSLFIIPITEPKPIVNHPSEPEVYFVTIPELESDADSNDSDMINELYHFEELDVNDVEIKWYDPYKAVSNDEWNEIPEMKPKTEAELQTEAEIGSELDITNDALSKEEQASQKDWTDDANSMAMEFLFDPMNRMD